MSSVADQLSGFSAPANPNETKGPLMVRVVWVLISISTAVMVLRLWTKVKKTRRLYWDDGLMVLALVRIDRL